MRLRTALKVGLAIAAVGLLAAGLAIAWFQLAPRRVPDGQPPLARLDPSSLDAFRDTFNAHDDEVRLLVLLSPT